MKLYLLLAIILILFLSCNTAKKEQERMQVYAVRYPDAFAILAAKYEPCFSGKAKSDTVTQVKADTTYSIFYGQPNTANSVFAIDTNRLAILPKSGTLSSIKQPVKPGIKQITITRTVTKTIHDTLKDQRAIDAITAQLSLVRNAQIKSDTELQDETKTAHTLLYLVIGLSLIIVGDIIYKIYGWVNGSKEVGLIKKIV